MNFPLRNLLLSAALIAVPAGGFAFRPQQRGRFNMFRALP